MQHKVREPAGDAGHDAAVLPDRVVYLILIRVTINQYYY